MSLSDRFFCVIVLLGLDEKLTSLSGTVDDRLHRVIMRRETSAHSKFGLP